MKHELERVAGLLSQTDPLSESYDKLLDQYITIYRIYKETDFLDLEGLAASQQEAEPAPKKRKTKAAPPEEPPAPQSEPVSNEPVAEYTAEYVRGLLSAVSAGGTPVQPLVKKYTPEDKPVKFSSIPVSRYPELVEELKTYAG